MVGAVYQGRHYDGGGDGRADASNLYSVERSANIRLNRRSMNKNKNMCCVDVFVMYIREIFVREAHQPINPLQILDFFRMK